MKIFREKQLNEKKEFNIIDILIILFLFAGPILNIILFIFSKKITSGQLGVVYIIVSIFSFLTMLFYAKRYIYVKNIYVIMFFFVFIFLFVMTKANFIESNSFFNSEFLAFVSVWICIILITINISFCKKTDISSKLILGFDFIITLVTLLALLFNDSKTGGGLFLDSSGFIYQNISYYAAYGLSFTIFLINEHSLKRDTRYNWMLYIIIILQIFIALISGGRGGVLLSATLLIYWIFIQSNKKKIFKIVIMIFILFTLLIAITPIFIDKFDIDIKGLERLLNVFDSNVDVSDIGRIRLYKDALRLFLENPINGNGLGSVFYYLGTYSHNMFIDILMELGIFGIIFFSIIMVYSFYKARELYSKGSIYRFLILVMICGLILNLVSGYIWVNQLVWLPVCVFFIQPLRFSS